MVHFRLVMSVGLGLVISLGGRPVVGAGVLHVSTTGADTNDGRSWETAKRTVTAGLAAATAGDEVWVAGGTYVERITLKAGVVLYGGFVGNELQLSQRDWAANVTILDGNASGSVVTAPAGATGATRIDGFVIRNGSGTPAGSCRNGGGIWCLGSSPSIFNNTITGNTATGGYGGGIYCAAASSPIISNNTITQNRAFYSGGGIYCTDHCSPQITGNVITGNAASNTSGFATAGGGIYCYWSSPVISNNTIAQNTANDGFGGGSGGGIACNYVSSPQISGNAVTGNTAGDGGGIYCKQSSSPAISNNTITGNNSRYGAGIYCRMSSVPDISVNTISQNTATSWGGGIYCNTSDPPISDNHIEGNSAGFGGGGVCCAGSSPPISRNTISTNSVSGGSGGGIYTDSFPNIVSNSIIRNTASASGGGMFCTNSTPTIFCSVIAGNTATSGGGLYCTNWAHLANSIIVGNRASASGGAIHNAGGKVYLDNCTISANTAAAGAGFYNTSSTLSVVNCIVWGNSGPLIYKDSYSTLTITYCDIQGNWAGTGNVDKNPKFAKGPGPGDDGTWGTVDDDYGNLRLQAGSPCIDAGRNADVSQDYPDLDLDGNRYEPLPFDLVGHPRFFNDPDTPDTGAGTAPLVDLGAYEFRLVPGDFDCNGAVDGHDLEAFTACATGPAIPYGGGKLPPGCSLTPGPTGFLAADLDRDGDVDQEDFGLFQRCFGGMGSAADSNCAD